MKLINRTLSVLTKPTQYFRNINKETGLKDAFIFFAVYSLIFGIIGLVVGYLMKDLMPSLYSYLGLDILTQIIEKSQAAYNIRMVIFMFVIGYPIGLALSFLAAALLHVWILIFDGKADYKKTYQLYVYTSTPKFIFGWIPFIGLFSSIYSLILLIYGTTEVHKIKLRTSTLMYIIPYVVLILLAIAVMVFAFLILSKLPLTTLEGAAIR